MALPFNDFYANSAQLLAIVVLALIWDSGYFEKLGTKQFPSMKWYRWNRKKVRVYTVFVSAVIIADMALCLLVLAGRVTNSSWWRIIVGAGLAVALGTLFFRMFSKVMGWDDTSSPDLTGLIEKLADLKAAGIVTDEEFENKKAKLLARIKKAELLARIEKLADLKAAGIVTREEFKKKKAELLARM